MPGTKNRNDQPPANARVRRAAHLERERQNHRKPSPERQARLHPPRSVRSGVTITVNHAPEPFDVDAIVDDLVASRHPKPWRAPDEKRRPNGDWIILDANGDVAEYAKSRDKARARAKEVNGS
jgi:hypothetical protein